MSDNYQKQYRSPVKCDFCGRTQSQVNRLIAGPGDIHICDNCIEMAHTIILSDKNKNKEKTNDNKTIPPLRIKKLLDEYIIGQEQAKKRVSVAVYNHYKRINNETSNDVELEKSNIMFIGPTGTGKTLMAQTLAKILSVPFAIADATTITEAGYVGEDVENVILKLYQAADGDVNKTQKGIIYIDEIDKIGRKTESPSITRDVSGEGVQQALLKIIEGTIANIPPHGGRKHPYQDFIPIDTRNILFICGGAFIGIDKIIEHRIGKSTVGFKSDLLKENIEKSNSLYDHLIPIDLQKYGLIPELIGRIPVISTFNELDANELVEILTKPKNAIIKQFKALFEMENVELDFTKNALIAIAEKSKEKEMGARGLRAMIEDLMLDIMFNLPSFQDIKKIKIKKNMIEKKELEFNSLKQISGV